MADEEWKEAQPPKAEPGPIWEFRRGYSVIKAGRHETAKQFACLQQYLALGPNRNIQALSAMTGSSPMTLTGWSKRFQWERRVAASIKSNMAMVLRETDKIDRDAHREAIAEFRRNSERQARLMSRVSEDLVRILGKRIADAEEKKEAIPLHMVSGLLRAATSLSEQSREWWGNSLGITELLDVVDAEVEKVRVEEVSEKDPYEFDIDE